MNTGLVLFGGLTAD